MNRMVVICLALSETNHHPKLQYHVAFSLAVRESRRLSTSSPASGAVRAVDSAILVGVCWCVITALICISLTTCDVGHLLFAICLFSLVRCLLKPLIHF